MDTVPQKYFLSQKACNGILKRAKRRGKKLPQILSDALHQQVARLDNASHAITAVAGTMPITSATIYDNHSQDCRYNKLNDIMPTVNSMYGTGGNNQPLIVAALKSYVTGNNSTKSSNPNSGFCEIDTSRCLDDVVAIQGSMIERADKNGPQGSGIDENVSFTLNATDRHAVAYRSNSDQEDFQAVHNKKRYIVRRLIPTECERLQGYPDNWTNLKPKQFMTDAEFAEWDNIRRKDAEIRGVSYKTPSSNDKMVAWYNKMITSDSRRYKALGNSIALPAWETILQRVSQHCDSERPTMGSLFDGIGGFPKIWEEINGKNSCLWASEIDPFCIAVTKEHFN